jgi:hypothetical protein
MKQINEIPEFLQVSHNSNFGHWNAPQVNLISAVSLLPDYKESCGLQSTS